MKRRGFTLVELLAVIVILAIIALIAVPILLGIINDSKNSSEKESLNLYTDTVEKAITKKQMSEPNFNPDRCEIKDKGNLECFKGTTSLGIVEVEMKGDMPNNGKVLIDGNKINYKNIVFNNKIYYETSAKLVVDILPTGISVGDKYTYKVNDNDTFNFYVLLIEGDKVNLIMDRNICNDGTTNYTESNYYCIYQWYSSPNSKYGPVVAMQELYAGTKDWDNVPNINLEYEDEGHKESVNGYGYTSFVINNGVGIITGQNTSNTTTIGTSNKPLKARLPKRSEVRGKDGNLCSGGGTCPTWLMEYMKYMNVSGYTGSGKTDKYSMNNNNEVYQNIGGYWLLSSDSSGSSHANFVNYGGNFGYNNCSINNLYGALGYGVRPVITVPLSDLN